MIDTIHTFFQNYLGLPPDTQDKIFATLLVLMGLWLLRFILIRIIHRQFRDNTRMLYSLRKAADYAIVVLGVFLVGRIWLEGITSLATYLGLLSAGLAIALQEPIVSLAGWAFILWRKPFDVGDRIQIGEHAGDVIDVRLFSFSMLEVGKRTIAEQSTGRIIHVPNGRVFSDLFANYSQGLPYIWNEIPITITFESNWENAKRLLTDIITRHAPDVRAGVEQYNKSVGKRFVIAYSSVTPTVYTDVVDSGVRLTLRYMIPPRERRGSEQAIWEDVLRAFGQHWDIDFAYPTQREYLHFRERKQPPPHEAPTVVMKRPSHDPDIFPELTAADDTDDDDDDKR